MKISDLIKKALKHDEDVERIDSQLDNIVQQIRPYNYINKGVAFDSSNLGHHASWTHSNVFYDNAEEKTIIIYNVAPEHTPYNCITYMRKKDKYGNYSEPVVVADRKKEDISCKTQASGILNNGDYICLVANLGITQKNIIGTDVYRSMDKGETWRITPMLCEGSTIRAFSGDVCGFLVLKSGRVIVSAWDEVDSKRSYLYYSDDNCTSWNKVDLYAYNLTEPAWAELSDGTIIAYFRDNVSIPYTNKNTPAWFTKSVDGGVTWETPRKSNTIIDYNNSNGHIIYHGDTKTVEFIHHSRYMQTDGLSSLYVSVANEENVKNDNFGEQIRIAKLAPQHVQIPIRGTQKGDSGYIGACKTSDDTIECFYYNGTTWKSQICNLVGTKTNITEVQKDVNGYTGFVYPKNNYIFEIGVDYFEQGSFNLDIGNEEVLIDNNTRIRSIKFNPILPSQYLVNCYDTNYYVGVRMYDNNKNLISDSGWKQDYRFETSDNVKYIKFLVKNKNDTIIIVEELKDIIFDVVKINNDIKPKQFLYSNGNENKFITNGFEEILKNNKGVGIKQTDCLELFVTNSTSGIDSYAFITPLRVLKNNYTKIKCNIVISGVSGLSEASLRLYNINNPSYGDHNRLALTGKRDGGRYTLEINLLDISTSITGYFICVMCNTLEPNASINAKVYDIWYE